MSELQIFDHWYRTLRELFTRTEKFPKKIRFSITSRLQNLGLEVMSLVIKAQYSKRKLDELRQANLIYEELRILLRLSHDLQLIDHKGFEVLVKLIDEAGRMTGGWIKQRQGLES